MFRAIVTVLQGVVNVVNVNVRAEAMLTFIVTNKVIVEVVEKIQF